MGVRRSFTVVSRIHSPEPAAASLRLSAVEKELIWRGHRVLALTSTCPQEGEDPAGLTVSRWPVLRDREGQLRGYLPYLSFDLPLLWRVLSRRRPAAFLVEPPPTTGAVMRVLAWMLKRPYVIFAPDVWSQAAASAGARSFVVRVVRALEGFALRGAHSVVAVTDQAATVLRQLGARSLSVVPNGVDTSVFHPAVEGPSELELAQAGVGGPYLLYAGTASEFQGAEIFARAAARLRGCQVVFIGQGSQWPRLRQLSRELAAAAGEHAQTGEALAGCAPAQEGRVCLPPVVVLDQMSPVQTARWQAGAIGALVSLRPGRGCDTAYPTKVFAALASGLPVLYAGVGPARADLTDPLLGEVVDYDVAAVAAAMQRLVDGRREEQTGGRQLCRPDCATGAVLTERDAREYRHQWVVRHHSTAAVGRAVADILEEAARQPFRGRVS